MKTECPKCGVMLDDKTWPAALARQGIYWCRNCWNTYFRERHRKKLGITGRKLAYLPENNPVSQEQLAWATGLWEAEGSISRDKDGLLTFRVVNTDILMLACFRIVVGCGTIRYMKEAFGNNKSAFVYRASGRQADYVLNLLLPFVVTKYRLDQISALTLLRQSMQMMPDSVEMAWVAGIFDGEGSVGSYKIKNRKTSVDMVKICNTQRDMLERVKSTVGLGGSLYESKHARLAGHKPIFYYSVAYAKAAEFLKLILPYSRCIEKIDKIETILGIRLSIRGRKP